MKKWKSWRSPSPRDVLFWRKRRNVRGISPQPRIVHRTLIQHYSEVLLCCDLVSNPVNESIVCSAAANIVAMRTHSSLIFATSCTSCLFCSRIAKSESSSVTRTDGDADDMFQKRKNREKKNTERDKGHERKYKKRYFCCCVYYGKLRDSSFFHEILCISF